MGAFGVRKLLITAGLLFVLSSVAAAAAPPSNRSQNFIAPLNTAEEVPEPTGFERNPRGLAKFHLSHDGTELHYKLIVANIENVTQAHIHGPAEPGDTAGVVVWLYPSEPPLEPTLIPGRFDGVLAEGVITEDDLIGALAGASVADLVDMIEDGDAYVNVHTQQNPPGEIRGQIR